MQWKEFSSYLRHLSPADQTRVERAFELGSHLHAGQLRKSGEPYFTHPIAITIRLAFQGADADTLIAALLHDTVEDTDATLEEIGKNFNGDVMTLIDGVTKLTAAEFELLPNLDTQIETLRKIFRLMQLDLRIMIIKLFDRLHNMETIRFLSPEKQTTLARETFDVYVKIADRLCMQDLRYELEGMCLSVLEPELYAKLIELLEQNKELSRRISETMAGYIDQQPDLQDKVKVHFEFKSWQKLRAQLNAGGSAATGVANATMIFVCSDRDMCYRVLGAIHEPWRRETTSFQDFINSPMINGYRGLHTTIILEDGTRIRCKIRTREMQEYAKNGVTTICFQPDRRQELEKLVPWTKRINSVADDTKDRSQDFWQSLQSDILGESIVVHGPDDQTIQLPIGATALDGAFYLFESTALSVESIKVDGKEIPFYTPLTHAVTLNASFSDKPTVHREWFRWIQTGYAMALTRSALASESEQKRASIGKELLQELMLEKKKGFLEEFDSKGLDERVQKKGFLSLDDSFIALAEGRIDTGELYDTLFGSFSNSKVEEALPYLISCTMDLSDEETMESVNGIFRTYWSSIQVLRHLAGSGPNERLMQLKLKVPPRRMEKIRADLELAGAKNIEVIIRSKREITLLATVIILWSLNPVLAKWLIINGMTTMSLLTIRFLVFSVFTTGFFLIWRQMTKTKFSPIPRLALLVGPATFWNAFNSTVTYLSISFLPPSVHLTILRFNALLISLKAAKDRKQMVSALTLLALLIALSIFLIASGYIALGICFSVVTLLSFTFYSLSLERTLQEHRIDIRYPYVLFQMGLLLGLTGIIMLFFQPISQLLHELTIPSIFYVLVCVCIPHACYSALLKTTRFKHFTDYFLLEVPLAMLLEAAILSIVLPLSLYAVIFITLVTLLVFQWRKSIVAVE